MNVDSSPAVVRAHLEANGGDPDQATGFLAFWRTHSDHLALPDSPALARAKLLVGDVVTGYVPEGERVTIRVALGAYRLELPGLAVSFDDLDDLVARYGRLVCPAAPLPPPNENDFVLEGGAWVGAGGELVFRAGPSPTGMLPMGGKIRFESAVGAEMVRLDADGRIFVHGKLIENGEDVVAGLRLWLGAALGQPSEEAKAPVAEIKWWPLKSVLNGMREEGPIGPKGAMALEHWHDVAKILMPEATVEETRTALDSLVSDGLMAFDPSVTITTTGGHKLTIAGWYRA